MHLAQDCHSRSLLSGDLRKKTRDLRLKHFEDDDYKKYLIGLNGHITIL